MLENVSETRFLRHSLRDSIGTIGNHPLGITILCQCVLFEEINLTKSKRLRELEMSSIEWILLG